jgi:hypothetical protein
MLNILPLMASKASASELPPSAETQCNTPLSPFAFFLILALFDSY